MDALAVSQRIKNEQTDRLAVTAVDIYDIYCPGCDGRRTGNRKSDGTKNEGCAGRAEISLE